MSQSLSVCVIGAGAAGLCAIKNSIEHGLTVTAFELTENIGGTWVYRDEIGTDKYGNDVQSSMYRGLVTNTPKEIMGYQDLPFPDQDASYITSEAVLNYYQRYAETFDLFKYIQFEHNVLRVRQLANKTWEVIVLDLRHNVCKTQHFDAVMVCNGHNSIPSSPKFNGHETFGGKQLHSHDFRNADDFKGERVCIIGAGPSASEMVTLISKVAEHVTWSNHSKRPSTPRVFGVVERKPDVQSIGVGSVTFVDGTTQRFSVIIYATGYLYTFPFLSIVSGLSMVDNRIRPLYKFCISVHHPTLAFIGLLNLISPNLLFDLQIKFFFKFLTGQIELPTKDEMLSERETNEFKEIGFFEKISFPMDIATHIKYYKALVTEANIDPVKPVIFKICEKTFHNAFYDQSNYRNVKFRVIDDENYEIVD